MIPINPITIAINGLTVDSALQSHFKKYLPLYSYHITSAYRERDKNEAVGGAKDSAHMYNLARDIAIKKGDIYVSRDQAKKLFDNFIKPYWEGFALFETHGNGYHIHLNLNRDVSKYVSVLGITGLVLGGHYFFTKTQKGKMLWQNLKKLTN